jgi:hypothetical protein
MDVYRFIISKGSIQKTFFSDVLKVSKVICNDAAALMMPMTCTARPIADASPASSIIQQVSEDI